MTSRNAFRDLEDHELLPTSLAGLDDFDDAQDDTNSTHLLTGKSVFPERSFKRSPLDYVLSRSFRHRYLTHRSSTAPRPSRRRSLVRNFTICAYALLAALLAITVVGGTFFPSYTVPPQHYIDLRDRVTLAHGQGGNIGNKKVFIAASLYDPGGKLTGGRWAENVLQLIDLLGPDNTYLSIYENDSGVGGKDALDGFRERVPCDNNLVFEDHLGWDNLPHVTIPDGTERVNRIEYLASVRNRALEPLQTAQVKYDKVLYLNDVFFDPIDVLQLLFSTNNEDYRAACAVDFINPFKFYDTFATRDLGGYSVGIPFFPWFAYGGDSRSHQDVVQGKDAVRVRSCWGGMVAFDARFFQPQPDPSMVPETAGLLGPGNISAPYEFRAEKDTYWDASECCLIQADIQSPDPEDPGIYMNPFVRVSYDPRTLSWLWFTRRFETLYTPVHFLLDIVVGFPKFNPRRGEQPWEQVEETVWVANSSMVEGGSFELVPRLASHSGFCGRRALPVMKEHFSNGEDGVKNYEGIPIPAYKPS